MRSQLLLKMLSKVGWAGKASLCKLSVFDPIKVCITAKNKFNCSRRSIHAEVAYRLAVSAASRHLVPREKRPDPAILGLEVWGRKFTNPIGLATGFDKNAEAVEGLLGLGFGFVEVGSVTPMPQEGNPKPRIFRLPKEGAIINRCGFNSEGIVVVAKRLGAQHGKRKTEETRSTIPSSNDEVKQGGKAGPGILGVNIGKNKISEDAAADDVQGVHTLSKYADYLVINVSSPNTPGLRKLQGRKQLKDLVKRVQAARDEIQWAEDGPPPLLVKIAPDLSKQDLGDIAAVALALRLDGLIISNTTISRPDPASSHPLAKEVGGLSGKPLFDLSTSILREMCILTRGKILLVGCGGISSGEDAYRKIRAGATLVQLYTAFAYSGPALIPQIQILQNANRHLMGDALSSLSIKELKQLESRLERGITRTRSKKHEMLFAEMEFMQKRKGRATEREHVSQNKDNRE